MKPSILAQVNRYDRYKKCLYEKSCVARRDFIKKKKYMSNVMEEQFLVPKRTLKYMMSRLVH